MARDPALLKVAAKAATAVLKNENSLRTVIIIAVTPLAALVLLISLFYYYILTMPLQLLGNIFTGNDYDRISGLREEHGFERISVTSADAALSPAEIAKLTAKLEGLSLDRQAFVESALSLARRVTYFWGGKCTAIS